MHINLLTFHSALNYGAVLQTYSLSKVLQSLGCTVSLLDLRPDCITVRFSRHPLGLVKIWNSKWFIRTFCPPLAATTRRPGEVARLASSADAWVVGSDQVWNPAITGPYAADYFLEDIGAGGKRIAYAASFGSDTIDWDDAFKQRARQWMFTVLAALSHFNHGASE